MVGRSRCTPSWPEHQLSMLVQSKRIMLLSDRVLTLDVRCKLLTINVRSRSSKTT